jgi:HK97 family phage major capsid protein
MGLTDTARELGDTRAKRQRMLDELTRLQIRNEGAARMSDGDAERWSNLTIGIERVDQRIADLEHQDRLSPGARQERLRQIDAVLGSTSRRPSRAPGPHLLRRVDPFDDAFRLRAERVEDGPELRDRALAAIEAWPVRAESQESAARLVDHLVTERDRAIAEQIVATSHPLFLRAFTTAVRAAAVPDLTVMDPACASVWTAVQDRAMSEGTIVSGAALAPAMLDPNVIATGPGAQNPFRALCTVSTITTKTWAGFGAGDVAASWDAESSEAAESPITLSGPTLTPIRERIEVTVSEELLMDADVLTSLATLVADAKNVLESTGFVSGTGSAQPVGLTTALDLVSTSRVSVATSGTFALVDCYSALTSLPARYKAGASWLANETVFLGLRQKPLASNVVDMQPWRDFPGVEPPKLVGHQAWSASGMVATVTSGADVCVVGDFSKGARVVDRAGLEMATGGLIGANNRPTAQRALLFWSRSTFGVINADSFRMIRA